MNRSAILLHAGSAIGHVTRSVDATSARCPAIWYRRLRAPHGLAEDRQAIKSQGTYPLRLSSVINAELARCATPDGTSFNQFVATTVGKKP